MSTKASRFWFLLIVIAADVSFLAGLGVWAPRTLVFEDEQGRRLAEVLDLEEATEPAARYVKALRVLASSPASKSEPWFRLRTATDRTAGGARQVIADVARRAQEFETSWTDDDRATLKKGSARALFSQVGVFSSFPGSCVIGDYENLRKAYALEPLAARADAVRSLSLSEEWSEAYLQRRAIRRLLENEPRFEAYRDLARTFYDEALLDEMKKMFPAAAGESVSLSEGRLLRAGVKAPEIRPSVKAMVALAPNCFTAFDGPRRFIDIEISMTGARAWALRVKDVLKKTGALPTQLSQLDVSTDGSLGPTDAWGSQYSLVHGTRMSIVSSGPDGRLGTSDDLVVWLDEVGER